MDAKSRRKNRSLLYTAIGAVVLVAAVVAAFLLQGDSEALGYEVQTLPGVHQPPYEYIREVQINGETKIIPPTSGNHLDQVSPYGFLGEDLSEPNVVHNMEHGAVVIWYKPGDPELAGQINSLVREVGRQCVVAGSYESMSFQVAATIWGRVLPQDTFDAAQLKEFIQEYRGAEGPEAGLCERQS
jgi:hypothetical protein